MRVFPDLRQNIYLQTQMDKTEYMHIKLLDIPQGFIEGYILTQLIQNGWVYFEILHVCYGLPQYGKLSNDLLLTLLKKSG